MAIDKFNETAVSMTDSSRNSWIATVQNAKDEFTRLLKERDEAKVWREASERGFATTESK
jgi:hypothetical protein